ncbi:hypothetical protein G3570_01945 [Balneolaceae bacterium YR4-1]|uniref:Uncharacterized protein n=1 Tax=Halalkalibaculum roseum TaxID=2709311 RepID=A0A6M1SXT3_9BACT|nr:hypothetical protein [Halalkalibaculum roseum]NGP75377.1 hypothetical protein [Halalkalibaculum roseum]
MRFSIPKLFTIALISLLFLPGCKDSNNNDENTSVLGLWQLNSNEGDISYVNITTTTVTSYDYMGDEYDEGPDCYEIDSQEILDVNGSKYTFSDPLNPNSTIEVDVTANGNQLTVVQPFGSVSVTLKFSKSNASINSFTPECEENQAKGNTVIF